MNTKTSVAATPEEQPKQVVSMQEMITHALDKGASIEVMERMFAMKKDWDIQQAKAGYVQAMATFQSECPVIKKTKKVLNKDGRTVRYMYAPIDSIVEQIKVPLAKAQLSYRWETKQEGAKVTAICFITHVLGHTESTDFTVDTDPEAYMTSPQKVASALTFAKRYTLCNGLGISTGDEDTDATDVKKEPSPKSDKSKIIFLARTLGVNTETKEEIAEGVLEHTKLKLEEKNFTAIVKALEAKVQSQNESN